MSPLSPEAQATVDAAAQRNRERWDGERRIISDDNYETPTLDDIDIGTLVHSSVIDTSGDPVVSGMVADIAVRDGEAVLIVLMPADNVAWTMVRPNRTTTIHVPARRRMLPLAEVDASRLEQIRDRRELAWKYVRMARAGAALGQRGQYRGGDTQCETDLLDAAETLADYARSARPTTATAKGPQ